MRIVKQELVNWMPFGGQHTLDLPSGPIAVVARYVSDAERSNWAGKTALLEAIDWALWGSHRKRIDDDVITLGEDRTSVRIVFDDGVVVHRSKMRGKAAILRVTSGSKEFRGKPAQELILERLSMNEVELKTTVRFSQGDIEGLCSQTSGKRQKLLRQWFGLEVFDAASKLARAHVTTFTTRAEQIERRCAELETELEEGPDIAELEAAIDIQTKVLAKAKEKRSLAGDAVEKHSARHAEVKALTAYHGLVDRGRQLRKTYVPGRADKLMAERDSLGTDDATIALGRARDKYAEVRKLHVVGFDGRCPVTRADCPATDHVKQVTGDTKERLRQAEKEQAGAEVTVSDLRDKWIDLSRKITEALRIECDFRETVKLVQGFKDSLGSSVPSADEVSEILVESDRKMVELKAERDSQNDAIIKAAKDLQSAEHNLGTRVTSEDELLSARADREVVLAELAAAHLAARALGPAGVPKDIAEAKVLLLEETSNALLEGTGLSISLSWQRETQAKAPFCYECGLTFGSGREAACTGCSTPRGKKFSNELEILVDDGSGVVEDVSMKSGGARVMVASAIRLAGASSLMVMRDSPVSWAVVDEPLGPLDAVNRGKLVRGLATMIGAVGIDQVLIVSHDAAVLDSLPARIEIVRRGDRSSVKVV